MSYYSERPDVVLPRKSISIVSWTVLYSNFVSFSGNLFSYFVAALLFVGNIWKVNRFAHFPTLFFERLKSSLLKNNRVFGNSVLTKDKGLFFIICLKRFLITKPIDSKLIHWEVFRDCIDKLSPALCLIDSEKLNFKWRNL